jgi:hypothetical protein
LSIDATPPASAATGSAASASAKPSRLRAILRKIPKLLLILLALGLISDWIWALSGSNRWELAKEGDGVKVYTLKAPGDRSIKVKAVMEGDYTLSQLTSLHIIDDNLQTCQDWFPNCVGFTRIKEFDPIKKYDFDMWRLDFPPPFSDRELLITTMVSQDPATKAVVLDVLASPNTLPHNDGAVRIERMHNRWQFTPKPNGKVEVELIQDTTMGGMFPYFLLNFVAAGENYKFFSKDLRSFLAKEKYVKAKLDFIEDVR